jgi:large subunit ribosomal protein L1
VLKAKPGGAKGNYLNKVSLSSTQGVGVKVDTSSISSAGPA